MSDDQSKLKFNNIPHVKSELISTNPIELTYDSSAERIKLEPYLLDSQTFVFDHPIKINLISLNDNINHLSEENSPTNYFFTSNPPTHPLKGPKE